MQTEEHLKSLVRHYRDKTFLESPNYILENIIISECRNFILKDISLYCNLPDNFPNSNDLNAIYTNILKFALFANDLIPNSEITAYDDYIYIKKFCINGYFNSYSNKQTGDIMEEYRKIGIFKYDLTVRKNLYNTSELKL